MYNWLVLSIHYAATDHKQKYTDHCVILPKMESTCARVINIWINGIIKCDPHSVHTFDCSIVNGTIILLITTLSFYIWTRFRTPFITGTKRLVTMMVMIVRQKCRHELQAHCKSYCSYKTPFELVFVLLVLMTVGKQVKLYDHHDKV